MVAQSNLTKRGSVIVAVSFNEHTKALIETAVDVCRRSDLGLRLLRVWCRPPPAIWYGEVTGGLRLADVAEAEFEISKNEALFQLEQLAKEIPAGIEVAVSVMTDEVADGLFSEVRTSDARTYYLWLCRWVLSLCTQIPFQCFVHYGLFAGAGFGLK